MYSTIEITTTDSQVKLCCTGIEALEGENGYCEDRVTHIAVDEFIEHQIQVNNQIFNSDSTNVTKEWW